MNHVEERQQYLDRLVEALKEWDAWLDNKINSGDTSVFLGNPGAAFWYEITRCKEHDYEVRWFVNANQARQYKHQCKKCLEGRGIFSRRKVEEMGLNPDDLPELNPFNRFEDKGLKSLESIAHFKGEQFMQEVKEQAQLNWRLKYESHLLSDKWQSLRQKVFKRANGICEGCGTATATEVHHLTYERLGDEMLFDLVAICRSCHAKIHDKKEEGGHV